MTCSDFHPHSIVDANGASDPFLPARIGQEMLSELLGRHGREVYQEGRMTASKQTPS
jgi:hypothetical protein